MRDLETMEMAIETAETGHLVLTTLHTNTAASTVDRIISAFPADRQNHVRIMLASSLKGVIAQALCKRKGRGLVAALEVLIVDWGVASMIRDAKTYQIPSAMQVGRAQGMRPLNDSLLELVRSGTVESTEAYLKSVDKQDLLSKLEKAGLPVPQV
jgi:twitching motility protein PilT